MHCWPAPNGPISSHVLFEVWLFAFGALSACSHNKIGMHNVNYIKVGIDSVNHTKI